MIVVGLILLILGFVLKIAILWTLGIIVLFVGVILMLLGGMGRAVDVTVARSAGNPVPASARVRAGGAEGGERACGVPSARARASCRYMVPGVSTSPEAIDVRRRAGWLPVDQDDLEAWLSGHRE